jgi:DNA-binding PadR family transcriptional regulator
MYLTRKEELILLTVFKLKDSAYLVSIREHLNRNTNKKWSVGNVYVPLDRMGKAGYLEFYIGEPTDKRGGKAIKYYRLTDVGLNALAEIKKVNDVMWEGLDNFAIEK